MGLLNNPIVSVALTAIVGLIIVYGLTRFVWWLFKEKQGYPGEAAIEAALFPFVAGAIAGAYKLSEDAMADLGRRLEGVDKKALADQIYSLLPETIIVNGVPVPLSYIKYIVPRERWRELVQDGFDRLMLLYRQNQLVLDEWLKRELGSVK